MGCEVGDLNLFYLHHPRGDNRPNHPNLILVGFNSQIHPTGFLLRRAGDPGACWAGRGRVVALSHALRRFGALSFGRGALGRSGALWGALGRSGVLGGALGRFRALWTLGGLSLQVMPGRIECAPQSPLSRKL